METIAVCGNDQRIQRLGRGNWKMLKGDIDVPRQEDRYQPVEGDLYGDVACSWIVNTVT